ncbi:hypothetical protein J2X65_000020 [Ancylobacter sp. 3268]|uniref:hypothetical protein n=1 Tax=Ancylobacter sp. 3268 TaxID=2817752 RepID=UPI00285ABEF2|nr:hypothetical protein [Ancylobacter sp. 3268]MDR6950677.1 hypothetical protein [Ancylobacter sp. 3268]
MLQIAGVGRAGADLPIGRFIVTRGMTTCMAWEERRRVARAILAAGDEAEGAGQKE